ncbi:hypothetical protein FQN52_008157 [Onygenales sp. PD_12]|nr:hypothetical protein FQN52_008157 [Onygenales sp. PD_12]KAK2796800.1 hypothetical protein FQN51_009024 [Onygenales sp. PD_10]
MAIPTTVGAAPCSTSPNTFLNGLPPNTKIYPYHGLSSIEEATDNSHPDFHPSESQYIVFNNVPESDLNTVLEEQLPGRADYDWRTQTLILKMVSQPHETLTHSLEWSINKKAEEMGVRWEYRLAGTAKHGTPRRTKEPDAQYIPRFPPQGRSRQLPTIVVETGFSESRPRLDDDAKFWLRETHGDVKIAIAAHINRRTGHIFFHVWEGSVASRIRKTQQVEIQRVNKQPVISGRLDRLTLHFSLFLLRRPNAAQGEKDIIIDRDELAQIAIETWEAMVACGYLRA